MGEWREVVVVLGPRGFIEEGVIGLYPGSQLANVSIDFVLHVIIGYGGGVCAIADSREC